MGSANAETSTPTIRRLVGVYNANGTAVGELAYFIGARLGRTHCSLCEITHGLVRERREWKACRANLRVPFEAYHLNDEPQRFKDAYNEAAPIVLAETDDDFTMLLGPWELSACEGSVERLTSAIDVAVDARPIRWPTQPARWSATT